ncbi:MAG: hypothetical protein WDN44_13720 [Sphingomonas sp.]
MALRSTAAIDEAVIRDEIAAADVVIGALGYRPRAIPLFDAEGVRIALMADAPGRPRLVDQQCRVIDAGGQPVAGGLWARARLGTCARRQARRRGELRWQGQRAVAVAETTSG